MAKEGYVGFKATVIPDAVDGPCVLIWSPTPGICNDGEVLSLLDEMFEFMTDKRYHWKDWTDWWNFAGSDPEEEVEDGV